MSFHELSADVVDMAQLATGLADDLSVQELRQSHQDPGPFRTRRAQRASPTVLRGDVAEAVAGLKGESGKDLHVIGSGELVQTLMHHDLVR